MAPLFSEHEIGPARVRTAGDLADIVRAAIVAGQLAPNERLIELDLARTLATNRALVRGALNVLEQERLVVRERNRGVRVRSYSAAEAAEILETRAMLEGLVARHAAQRIDAGGVATLYEIIVAMRQHQAVGDLVGYSQLNAQYHRTILELSQHTTAAMLLAVLQSQAVRYAFRTVLEPGRPAHSLAEHEAIFAALQARDPDGAERAMHAHLRELVNVVRAIGCRDSSVLQFP